MTSDDRQRRPKNESAEEDVATGSGPAEATDGNPLGLDDLDPPPRPQPWRLLGLFIFVLLAMSMLATVVVIGAAGEKKAALVEAEEKRLRESAFGRAKVLRTWLDGQFSASRRLTESQVFRLFVHDLALQDPRAPLPRYLQDQRPYFQQLVTDFARQNELIRATILRHDGAVLLTSSGPALAVDDLLRQLEGSTRKTGVILSPIRQITGDQRIVVVDAIIPVPQAQS
ncbi:MAG: hypothetical protein AAF543_19665, partial [Pseudomonadota bacterium]